jgi:hypothetical protein
VNDEQGRSHMGVPPGTLNRSDFGMTGYQRIVGNQVMSTIDADLVQATTNAAK